MRKLYNIVKYIKFSLLQTQVFQNISGSRIVRQDNRKRWNLWYKILDLTTNHINVSAINAAKYKFINSY